MTNLLGKKEELKMFSSENDFINHLKVVRDNSSWNTLQSGETSFEVENGILYVLTDGMKTPVRECGLTSVENRCELYGSAIERLMLIFPNLVGETLTKAIQSKKNSLMKGYLQYGEYSAIHSDTYTPIDMVDVFEKIISHIKGLNILDDDCIASAEWSFDRTSALFVCNNAKLIESYSKALKEHEFEVQKVVPKVRVTVSDIATSGINMNYSIDALISGTRYRIPLSSDNNNGIYHKGTLSKKMTALQDKLDSMFNLFSEAIENITKLMDVVIYNPVNCMIGLFKSLKLPVKYSSEVVSKFMATNGDTPCSAYEVYAGMAEYVSIVETVSDKQLTELKKLQLEETLAKALKKDFTNYDVSGTVAW